LVVAATALSAAAAVEPRWVAFSVGEPESPLSPIERDLGPAIAAVSALYEATFPDACVMEWTLDEATMELTEWLQAISLGQTPDRG
jgi:hypothetical protein